MKHLIHPTRIDKAVIYHSLEALGFSKNEKLSMQCEIMLSNIPCNSTQNLDFEKPI